MKYIYHISSRNSWNEAQETGAVIAPSLDTEGFIHCCKEEQIPYVWTQYFKGLTGLVLLKIDLDLLISKIEFVWVEQTQDSFPHVYGPINLISVTDVKDL